MRAEDPWSAETRSRFALQQVRNYNIGNMIIEVLRPTGRIAPLPTKVEASSRTALAPQGSAMGSAQAVCGLFQPFEFKCDAIVFRSVPPKDKHIPLKFILELEGRVLAQNIGHFRHNDGYRY
jgi:hypothetical protein